MTEQETLSPQELEQQRLESLYDASCKFWTEEKKREQAKGLRRLWIRIRGKKTRRLK